MGCSAPCQVISSSTTSSRRFVLCIAMGWLWLGGWVNVVRSGEEVGLGLGLGLVDGLVDG